MLKKILYGTGGTVALLVLAAIAVPSAPQQTAVTAPTPADVVSPKIVDSAPPSKVVAAKPFVEPTQAADLFSVVKVVDGDTVTISMNGTSETIRLIGINTPETVDPRKPVECFGVQASNKAKELLSGKKVRIEKDPSQGDRDKYNRLLAYIFREDGLFFNKYMVEQGYAYEYTYNTPYKYQSEFKVAQVAAQKQQLGLWAPDACNQQVAAEPPATQPQQATAPVAPAPSASGYNCSTNSYNCTDFTTHAQAQAVYEACGGVDHDIHRLDGNHDGEACEDLP